MASLEEIYEGYYQIVRSYHAAEDNWRKARIEYEEARQPNWVEDLVRPLAKEIIKEFPGYHFRLSGPSGLGARVWMRVNEKYKEGLVAMLAFAPGTRPAEAEGLPSGPYIGKVCLVDYSRDTGEYAVGTVGYQNGFNYPEIPLPDSIEDLVAMIQKQIEKRAAEKQES
jgi:hypothetical protein